jgi:opacity protein-like surface antigen
MFKPKPLLLSTLTFSVSALALAAVPAAADDLGGTRIGVHADYLWGDVSPSGFAGAGDTSLPGYDVNSGGVGLDLRHDWQSGDTVYGLYASFTSLDATGGTTVEKNTTDNEGITVTEDHGFDTDLSWLASAGGRVGMVIDGNKLLYAQAGFASGKIKIVETGDGAGASRSVNASGYTVSAGIDVQLNDEWSLGLSVSHYDLGDVDFAPDAFGTGQIETKGSLAAVNLAFRFY